MIPILVIWFFKNDIKSINRSYIYYIYLIIIELSRTMLIVKLSKWLMLLWKNTRAKERNKISKSGSFFFVTTNILWVVTQSYWMSNSALILSISIVGQILKMNIIACLGKKWRRQLFTYVHILFCHTTPKLRSVYVEYKG